MKECLLPTGFVAGLITGYTSRCAECWAPAPILRTTFRNLLNHHKVKPELQQELLKMFEAVLERASK